MKPNEIEYISLNKLIFDPQNPRLPKNIDSNNDEEIIKYMLRDASLLELMRSITEIDYSHSEPLLIVPNKKNDNYIVVEGNRRLAALKLLSEPTLATVRIKSVNDIVDTKKHTPSLIPCILHKKREDILDYLGYRHITGVKSWGSLEKARYVEQLLKKHKIQGTTEDKNRILANMIGSRADHVGRLLSTLKLYEFANDKAYFEVETSEKDIDFSILYTAIGYKNIHEHIGLKKSGDFEIEKINIKNYEFIFKCLYGPSKKITESRQLSDLNAVVGNETALNKFKNDELPLDEAVFYTDKPLETFKTFLEGAKKYLLNARTCMDSFIEPPEDLDGIIIRIRELEKIARSIRRTLEEDED